VWVDAIRDAQKDVPMVVQYDVVGNKDAAGDVVKQMDAVSQMQYLHWTRVAGHLLRTNLSSENKFLALMLY